MDKGTEKLYDVAIKAHDILFSANTVFPFTLFPNTITIDREKVTIVHRPFFRMAKIVSVRIHDLLNVESDVGPFFGTLHLTSRYFLNNPESINFLWRSETAKAQRLLQGYIIAQHEKVNCSNIPKDELIVLLDDLGRGASD
ncbi:hypothetical protein A3F65_00535 [Candidatus Saccharibacteria bacterium RIFCSPHIGHO2_12_FULL_47_16b]|nr:MAG: hypothetical protein A3F65_00535 [Candidatus Saccharibacteria bacterium RIFCSPHIGHO2_12_FULL_47_16b]